MPFAPNQTIAALDYL